MRSVSQGTLHIRLRLTICAGVVKNIQPSANQPLKDVDSTSTRRRRRSRRIARHLNRFRCCGNMLHVIDLVASGLPIPMQEFPATDCRHGSGEDRPATHILNNSKAMVGQELQRKPLNGSIWQVRSCHQRSHYGRPECWTCGPLE